MSTSESVQTYLSWTSAVVSQMRVNGEKLTNETIVSKILRSLTPKLGHVVAAVEEFKDLTMYSFDDLLGSLQAHEDKLNKSSTKNKKKAFYVKGESSYTKLDDKASNRVVFVVAIIVMVVVKLEMKRTIW